MLESILYATLGGVLIGTAASLMLLLTGRIAGISGIVGGLFTAVAGDRLWRFGFFSGLVAGGVAGLLLMPSRFGMADGRSTLVLCIAGVLVGVGTQMGSGCTSGHGVCGLSRFSPRSLVATLTFMGLGFATASGFHMLVLS